MGKHPRDLPHVYHLTALTNVEGIVRRGLRSRAALRRDRCEFADVADREILDRRARWGLDEHVPFHFFPRNPFDGAVLSANPETAFVVLAVHRTLAARAGWSVIPRHPLTDHDRPQVLAWSEGLAAVEWARLDALGGRNYADRLTKLACLAEALGPAVVPIADIDWIYVPDASAQAQVARHLAGRRTPQVTVNSVWCRLRT